MGGGYFGGRVDLLQAAREVVDDARDGGVGVLDGGQLVQAEEGAAEALLGSFERLRGLGVEFGLDGVELREVLLEREGA